MNEVSPHGFKHNEQSVRVVECLEKQGQGWYLSVERRGTGILNHKTSGNPPHWRGRLSEFRSKIAYINHDIDVAIWGVF